MNFKQLLHTMSMTVETTLEAYTSDFYDYDVKTLSTLKDCEAAIWLLRDCGTFLIKCNPTNRSTLDALFQSWDFKGMYLVSNISEHFGLAELKSEDEVKETMYRLSCLL